MRCSNRSFAKIGPTSANIACECTTTPTLAQSCTCDRNQTPITQSICNVGPMIFAIWAPRMVYCAIYSTLTHFTEFRVFNLHITSTRHMQLIGCTNVFTKGGYPVTLLPPPRRLTPSLGLGTTWVRQPRSGSCHYLAAATKCNVRTEPSHSKPRQWKSMLIHQGWFTALYTLHLLTSQSFDFLICILQALNMPLIRCTNVFYQGRLSRHIFYVLIPRKHIVSRVNSYSPIGGHSVTRT